MAEYLSGETFEGFDGRRYREVDRRELCAAEGMPTEPWHICEGCVAWPFGGKHNPMRCKMLPECGVGNVFVEVREVAQEVAHG